MKKWCIWLVVLCLSAFTPVAASGEAEDADETSLEFSLSVDIDIPGLEEFPVVDAAVREWVRDYVVERLYDRHDKVSADRGGMTGGEWELRGYSEAAQSSPDAISVMFGMVEHFPGDESRSIVLHSLNFDAGSGRRLTLDDMFEHPAKALEIISAVSIEHLDEWLREEYPEVYASGEGAASEGWPNESLDPDADNFGTLAVDPEGLRVLYQMNQLPSFAEIPTTAVIPIALLEEAGPNPRIWPESDEDEENE